MDRAKLGRREFLRLSAVAAAGAAAVACQPQTVIVRETVVVEGTPVQVQVTKVVKETVEVEKVVKETVVVEKEKTVKEVVEVERASLRQSPMLTELVKSGALPPLEDRLPVSPKVCTDGIELPRKDLTLEIGKYGGTLRSVHPSPGWNAVLFIAMNEPLVNAPGVGVREPGVIWSNVVRDYKVSSDEKEFTFQLREGIKWSDGVPVTTEDIQFAFDDVLLNEQITPRLPSYLLSANKASGTPMVLEIVDAYTFRCIFDQPYGGFLTNLALVGWQNYHDLIKPKHYLSQFHADYTPLADIEPLIAEADLQKGEWWTLFNDIDCNKMDFMRTRFVDFPLIDPWDMTENTPTRVYWDRNPYYWKVDSTGQQLPYMDKVESELVQDMQMVTMQILAGEVDFISYGTGGVTAKNLPLYKENEEKGGYKVHLLGVHNTPTNVFLNLTNADPVWRQVVGDVRFRQALNMAINRDEIIEAVYYNLASKPWQIPSDYDPDQANAILDEIGLDKRDADGFRLGPDGNVFEIPFEINPGDAEDISPVTELIVEYWNKIGVKSTMKSIEGGLLGTRRSANELKANVTWNATLTMWWQIWGMLPSVGWGILWNQWLTTNGESGEEPPEEIQRFVNLINESVAVNPESGRRQEIIDEYLAILHEQIYGMTTVIDVTAPLIVQKDIRNIATDGYAIAAYMAAELWYYDV